MKLQLKALYDWMKDRDHPLSYNRVSNIWIADIPVKKEYIILGR